MLTTSDIERVIDIYGQFTLEVLETVKFLLAAGVKDHRLLHIADHMKDNGEAVLCIREELIILVTELATNYH